MIDYFQKNYNLKRSNTSQKAELEKLREQVEEYRKRFNTEDNEMEVSSENESVPDIEEQKKIDEELRKRQQKKRVNRSSVSAEVYGLFNKKKPFKPRVIPKTNEQIERIKDRCMLSFLFNSLEEKDLKTVIDSFEEKKYKAGENVITQGEEGDVLYLVDNGELDCEKVFKAGDPPTHLKIYKPGESFGELALLYNAPRAATITADSDEVITWVLDRETFNHIVKEAAQKKREKYENFLKKVDILSTIDPYELMQISDALKTATFKKGDFIIKEGEMGDVFYILEEGNCEATKTLEPGKPDTIIKEYSVGDYFGERALIKGEPRACNIIASSDTVKVISLDRISFKRLLGPIEELLKRNIDKYQNIISSK